MAAAPELHHATSSLLLANLAVMPPAPAVRVRFGPYELDTKAGELRLGDDKVILPDQPHKILLMLIERPGDIVTRAEIQKRLWADDVIVSFEVSINQAIRKLRRALNDSADDPKYVETVGRRGYRLKVPVATDSGSCPARRKSDLSRDHRWEELSGSQTVAACHPEDLRAMAATLVSLLRLLTDMGTPIVNRSQLSARQSIQRSMPS